MEVLKESRSGNINKKGLQKNKSPKRDLRGAPTKLLGVVSLTGKHKSALASSASSLQRPCLTRRNSLERTFSYIFLRRVS